MVSNQKTIDGKGLIKEKREQRIESELKNKKCIIIDEHPICRLGIQNLLENDRMLQITADVATVDELFYLDDFEDPDVAILNVSIEGKNSLESVKTLKELFPRIRILVLAIYDEKFLAKRIIRAGAHGYLMKEAGREEVRLAVHDIIAGKIYFSDFLRNFMLESMFEFNLDVEEQRIERLSDREFEVFLLLGKGISMNQIATKLRRTLSTIETYKRNIKRILQFSKTARLKEFAVRWVKQRDFYR